MPETVTAARAAQLVGVSEKTMLRWLAAGKVKGAREPEKRMGEPARWEVPVSALDGLRRSARPSDDLASVVEELRATVDDLRRRLERLEAPSRDGARQQAAMTALKDFRIGASTEPSESPLDALQRYVRSTGRQRRGVGGQDVPPEPRAVRLGHVLQEHGVVSESGAVSSYWMAQTKAARSLAGVYTQPSQRNRDVSEYWVLRSGRETFVRWLIEHPNAKAHACDDPECACQGQLPPALGARPEVPTVRRPDLAAVLADASAGE